MATNFRVKIGEIGLLIFIRRLDIPKRIGISQFRFQKFKGYTACKNLVNFGLVTPEFTRVVATPLIDQQFNTFACRPPLMDTAGTSTKLCGTISTQFCFTYSLEGGTARPRGLHARLCHAFLIHLFIPLPFLGIYKLKAWSSRFTNTNRTTVIDS